MFDTTWLLLALVVVLFVATLVLGWLLARPKVSFRVERQRDIPTPPPPTHIKCNVRHYIFQRANPETQEIEQRDVWRHPYCEGLPLDFLTDEIQSGSFLKGHPDQGWRHTETRGEMHMVKA